MNRLTRTIRPLDLAGLLVQCPARIRIDLLTDGALHTIARRRNWIACLRLPAAVLAIRTCAAARRAANAGVVDTLERFFFTAFDVKGIVGILARRYIARSAKHTSAAPNLRIVIITVHAGIRRWAILIGLTSVALAKEVPALHARSEVRALFIPGAVVVPVTLA